MKAFQRSILYDRKTGTVSQTNLALHCQDEADFSHIVENQVVGLYPAFRFQTLGGFGCAMTEAACYLLSGMSEQQRKETLSLWFGPEETKARLIRIPMDSCDYSLSEYQAVKDPLADPELATFSLERDQKYILPVVKEALEMSGGRLSVLMSPWSPPAVWKTPPLNRKNDASAYGGQEAAQSQEPSRSNGGSLKPEYYGSWARYLVKYIQAYRDEGIPVTMLSVQNEAAAATPWDSCVWTGAQEKTFLRDFLIPEMKQAGLFGKVKVFIWDHNKERMVEHIGEMMDETTLSLVDGFAYHWYTGDHFEALGLLKAKYPDKVLLHSESCPLHIPGRTVSADMDVEALKKRPRASLAPEELAVLTQDAGKTPQDVDLEDAFAYAHDILGDLNHGMDQWIDWNLIVDEHGGPRHVPGGFAAPLVLGNDGRVIRTVSYEYLKLIMEALPSGSVRVGCSVFGPAVEAAAAVTPGGSIRVLLFHPGKDQEIVNIRLQGQVITAELPGESLTSVSITC